MTTYHIDQESADRMLKNAIATCAGQFTANDQRRALLAIQRGEREICECLRLSLIDQLAKVLGEIDRTVKSVYTYESIVPPQSGGSELPSRINIETSINLVVWVERKSAALSALAESLQNDLQESQKQTGCLIENQYYFTINVNMVDDQDVQNHRGFGAIADSEYLRSKRVWRRISQLKIQHKDERTEPEGVLTLPDYFDPGLIPEERLLAHAGLIEELDPEDRTPFDAHLTELKVILIRRLISDQLAYIDIAKNWFKISDLKKIHNRRIGYGKIGGKSAGMLLAERILREEADEDVRNCLKIPESYFLGSDLIYIFMVMNGLMHWNDQKYKPEEQIWNDYPQIMGEFLCGQLPPEIIAELKGLLNKLGNKPLIVRSSSQLEDNFGTSFAGKYDSYFCPNQGTADENLKDLTEAIIKIYASTLNPGALLYRRSKGLQDYDERMAILIQAVQGEKYGKYYFPQVAGVAFSRNIYRWSPQIKQEDGFLRIVWGLGTRAVQRVGDDYPRLVALSHPTLQPDDSPEAIRRYSQQYVDLIDLEENSFKTLPVQTILHHDYPPIRLFTQLEQDGFFVSPRMRVSEIDIPQLAITFHDFLQRSSFVPIITSILEILELHYHSSVDMEFTVQIDEPRARQPQITFSLLQCRPLSTLINEKDIPAIDDVADENILFSSHFMVPQGYLSDIQYIVYINPSIYFTLQIEADRREIGKIISKINSLLGKKSFICIGPGRWGSLNLDLGVFVSYADIDNAGALVEISGQGIGPAPEPSLGTHFFQDLMEAKIYPLAINLDDEGITFNRDYFESTQSRLVDLIPNLNEAQIDCVRLIDIKTQKPGYHFEAIMDAEKGKAIGFLAPDKEN